MEQRGIRSHGFHGVEDRRQHFVVDVDAQERFFGGFGRLRRDRGDPVADVTHPVPAQHRHVPQDLPHEMTRGILSGHHGLDAGDTPGRGGINATDASVGMRTAQNLAPKHAGHIHVGGEARASGHFLRPLNLGDRGPYKRCLHVHLIIPLV